MAMTIPHLTYHQLVLAARQLPLPERVRFVRDILAEPIIENLAVQDEGQKEWEKQEGEQQNSEQQVKWGRSVLDIIESAPGQRLFKTAEEVDAYLEEERNSWDR
jgi:hypothetical protein